MTACAAADVRVMGVNVYEYQAYDNTLQEQLTALAEQTGAFMDKDGDGAIDDPAVLYGSWDWPALNQVLAGLHDIASYAVPPQ